MLDPKLITWGTGKELDLILLENVYNDVIEIVKFEQCDRDTRNILIDEVKKRVPSDYKLKCDEENNPPNVVNSGMVFMRVSREVLGTTYFIDIIF